MPKTKNVKKDQWDNALLDICPDCRAGKEWIEHNYSDKPALCRQDVESECMRCGYTKEDVLKL